ncbi:MAG: hypothetical protein LBT70_02000 [Holosporaceae bacterium]|jgi:hypothetical protein|nr:hypothetical protein [Holosporaceae bacterium]
MKKILMLAVGASQLLLLPQINAVTETKKIITVPEDFEIKNGLQGLDRDAHLMIAEKIAQNFQLTDAVNKIRNFLGISQRTFAYKGHKKFEYMVSAELKRQIFQQPIEVNIGSSIPEVLASDDKNTIIAEDSGIFFRCLKCSVDRGQTWYETNIQATEVKYMNGKFFAFNAKKIKEQSCWEFSKENIDEQGILVSEDGMTWTSFFKPSSQRIETMAYGNDKYVMVTREGQMFTKTKDSGSEWKKSSTSFVDLVDLDKRREEAEKSIHCATLCPLDDHRPEDKEIVFARGKFLLRLSYKQKTYFCASTDGENWVSRISNEQVKNLVGGPLGFACLGKDGYLYYSSSGDYWDTIPPKSGEFSRVIYFNSSFYGDMFIASAAWQQVLVGIPRTNYIEWSWIKLKSPSNMLNQTIKSIKEVNCIGEKIIIKGENMDFQSFMAQL